MARNARVHTEPHERPHLLFLDGLRALAALFVVMHHSWLQVIPGILPPFPSSSIKYTSFMVYGPDAVDLFIVLSGFCLMMPVVTGDMTLRGGPLRFYKRRAKRILPPYYLAMLLSLALIFTLVGSKTGTHWDVSLPVSKGAIASAVFMLQNVLFPSKINHVFWSVAVEWQIYFWFPLFILLWKRFTPLRATVGVIFSSYVLSVASSHVSKHVHLAHINIPGMTFRYYGLFAAGMLASGIAFSPDPALTALRRKIPWGLASTVLAIMLIGVYAGLGYTRALGKGQYIDLLVGLLSASIMITCVVKPECLLHRVLSARPLVFVGTFAYSVYLTHAPMIQILWQYVCRPLGLTVTETFWFLIVIGTPIIVGIAYLFFLICERPFITRKPGRHSLAHDAALSPAP